MAGRDDIEMIYIGSLCYVGELSTQVSSLV